MRQTERTDESATDRTFRWYIAPMIPQTFDLERHFVERRSLAEVRAKRQTVTQELGLYLLPATSDPAPDASVEEPRLPGSRSTIVDELRARAERYRKLTLTLSDPRVISALKACVRELEAEAALIARMGFDHASYPLQRALTADRPTET